jgi:hypothetical protein
LIRVHPHCNDNDIGGGNLSSPPAKRTAYASTSNADKPSICTQAANTVFPQENTTICIQEQLQVPSIDHLVTSSTSPHKSHVVDIVMIGEVYLHDHTSTSIITATTVSTTYTHDQQKEGYTGNDTSVKSIKETDSFSPDEYYNATIIKHIMAAGEDELCVSYDPHGFNSTKRTMPSTYCQHCHFPMRKCHNVLFGKYCQLHIIEVGQFCTYDTMTKLL